MVVVQWLAPHLKARRSRFKSHLGPLCVEFALVLPQPGWHLLKEVENVFSVSLEHFSVESRLMVIRGAPLAL